MLPRQDLGRSHQHALHSAPRDICGGQQRDDRLARPDVADDHPVHTHISLHIANDILDRRTLARRQFERQRMYQIVHSFKRQFAPTHAPCQLPFPTQPIGDQPRGQILERDPSHPILRRVERRRTMRLVVRPAERHQPFRLDERFDLLSRRALRRQLAHQALPDEPLGRIDGNDAFEPFAARTLKAGIDQFARALLDRQLAPQCEVLPFGDVVAQIGRIEPHRLDRAARSVDGRRKEIEPSGADELGQLANAPLDEQIFTLARGAQIALARHVPIFGRQKVEQVASVAYAERAQLVRGLLTDSFQFFELHIFSLPRGVAAAVLNNSSLFAAQNFSSCPAAHAYRMSSRRPNACVRLFEKAAPDRRGVHTSYRLTPPRSCRSSAADRRNNIRRRSRDTSLRSPRSCAPNPLLSRRRRNRG